MNNVIHKGKDASVFKAVTFLKADFFCYLFMNKLIINWSFFQVILIWVFQHEKQFDFTL